LLFLRFFVEGFLCDEEFVIRGASLMKGFRTAEKPENFLQKVKMYYQPEWFQNQTGSWNTHFKPIFIETLTRRGYGFTFNMLDNSKMFTDKLSVVAKLKPMQNSFLLRISKDLLSTSHMTLEFPGTKGLNVSTDNYPLMSSSRPSEGLRMTLERNDDVFFVDRCTSPSFLIHSPYELPGSYDTNDLFEFGNGHDFEVLITPEIITTDEGLRSYDPEERGCFFQDERKLKYFKVYTKNNCMFECRAEQFYVKPKLNCTPFFMVRSDDMEFCDYRREYQVRHQTQSLSVENDNCGCLDACDSIKYQVEVFAHNLVKSNDSTFEELEYSESTFHFKFKDTSIIPLLRYHPISFTDFLAQSGGMLGLFAGISMLSIVELIYFMSIRWIIDMWRWMMKRNK
jgi:acid-sensing ion channel, other